MTTSVSQKTEAAAHDEPPFPIVHVTDLLKAFVKAVRATQMYLPNNPMHTRSIDAVREAFNHVWQHTDELILQVVETRLEWEGKTVLDEGERTSDNVA